MQKKFLPTYFNGIGVAIKFLWEKSKKLPKISCFFGHISELKNYL